MSLKRFYSVFLTVLFIVPTDSFAQYLNQLYDYDTSNDWGYDVFVESDSNYFILGGEKHNFGN